jgi:hypothetical protein
MTSRRAPEEQTLTLRGSAYRQRDIGDLMLQLEELSWSGVPALGYAQASTSTQGKQAIDFEVSVPLKRVIGSDLR